MPRQSGPYGSRNMGGYRKRRNYNEWQMVRSGGRSNSNRAATMARYAGYANTAVQALRIAQQVAALINVEFKKISQSLTTAASTTPTFQNLILMAQGNGQHQRNGNQVKLKSVLIRVIATRNPSATSSVVRMILFVDKSSNGLTPTITDLLLTSSVTSPLNSNNGKRFRVLADEFFSLSNGSAISNAIKIYRKLNITSEWETGGATVGDISNNQLWLVYLSDEATNTVSIAGTTNVSYVDN